MTEIETAKSLTGHNVAHILRYLHTDEKRQREAMNKREGKEVKLVLVNLYNQIKVIVLMFRLSSRRSVI